jgi:hypothetical protein
MVSGVVYFTPAPSMGVPSAPLDPRQFMLKHKFRVHNGTSAAGIHEKGTFTLVIFAMFIHPVEDGLDKQPLAVLWQRRLCFLVFG